MLVYCVWGFFCPSFSKITSHAKVYGVKYICAVVLCYIKTPFISEYTLTIQGSISIRARTQCMPPMIEINCRNSRYPFKYLSLKVVCISIELKWLNTILRKLQQFIFCCRICRTQLKVHVGFLYGNLSYLSLDLYV